MCFDAQLQSDGLMKKGDGLMKKYAGQLSRGAGADAGSEKVNSVGDHSAPANPRTWLRWHHVVVLALVVVAVFAGRHFWQQSRLNQFRNAAQIATENQRWGRLSAVSKMWLEYQSGNSEALFAAGLAAYMRGDETTAWNMLQPIQSGHPMFAERCVLMAKMTSGPEHLPAVPIGYLKQAVQFDPSLIEHRRLLLRQYGLTFQRHSIAPLVRNAVAHEADTPAMYVYLIANSIVTYRDGETLANQWAALAEDPEPYLVMAFCHAAQAKQLNETGLDTTREDFEENTVQLQQRLDTLSNQYPDNLELIFKQLELASDEGDDGRMRRWLSRIPASKRDDPRPWYWKGVMHVMRREWSQAEAAFRESIQLDPFDWIACHQLGTVLAQQGKVESSKRYLELGAIGNQIRREITDLKSIDHLTPSLLHKMRRFAVSAEQPLIARRLKTLIERGTR